VSVRLYIYDLSSNLVNDPERTTDYATGISVGSMFPKGHSGCSFTVKRDIAARWAIKNAYEVIVRDGTRIVYQGILKNINYALQAIGETVRIEARGYYSLLAQRYIRKRWADSAPFSRFYWPSGQLGDAAQERINSTIAGNLCRVRLPGSSATSSNGDDFLWRYDAVPTDTIKNVTFTYYMISGSSDTFILRIWNGATDEADGTLSVTNTSISGTFDTGAFTGGDTNTFDLGWVISATDGDADGNGYVHTMTVYTYYNTPGSENYYADEIIKDILEIIGDSDFSVDYDQVNSPEFALIPFTTTGYETADTVIQRAVGYGDASNNTWAFSVWDEEYKGTASDGLPKVELIQRPVLTDWEYDVMLGDLETSQDAESLDELFNYIVIQYTDADDKTAFIDPVSDATLKDQTSIDAYYRRDKYLTLGKSTAAKALEYGERFLALHKDPLRKTAFSLVGQIRTKQGVSVPASWVRAGQRVRIADYKDQPVILLGKVDYDDDSQRLTCQADLPPDSLAVYVAQETLRERAA